jgi:hypothetical protein
MDLEHSSYRTLMMKHRPMKTLGVLDQCWKSQLVPILMHGVELVQLPLVWTLFSIDTSHPQVD